MHFRPLVDPDLPMLCDWLNRPHLQVWWREGLVTEAALREKYLPRIAGVDDARPFIALEDGEPVGYIQVYRADAGAMRYWPDTTGFGVLGIDQFLADGERLDHGIGTRMVATFARRLLEDPEFVAATFNEPRFIHKPVTEIRVDPRPDNLRAIRCYEKVGFRRVLTFQNPDGPAVMMVLKPGLAGGARSVTFDSGARR